MSFMGVDFGAQASPYDNEKSWVEEISLVDDAYITIERAGQNIPFDNKVYSNEQLRMLEDVCDAMDVIRNLPANNPGLDDMPLKVHVKMATRALTDFEKVVSPETYTAHSKLPVEFPRDDLKAKADYNTDLVAEGMRMSMFYPASKEDAFNIEPNRIDHYRVLVEGELMNRGLSPRNPKYERVYTPSGVPTSFDGTQSPILFEEASLAAMPYVRIAQKGIWSSRDQKLWEDKVQSKIMDIDRGPDREANISELFADVYQALHAPWPYAISSQKGHSADAMQEYVNRTLGKQYDSFAHGIEARDMIERGDASGNATASNPRDYGNMAMTRLGVQQMVEALEQEGYEPVDCGLDGCYGV